MGLDTGQMTERMGGVEELDRRIVAGDTTTKSTKEGDVSAKTNIFGEKNEMGSCSKVSQTSNYQQLLVLLQTSLQQRNKFQPSDAAFLKENCRDCVSSSHRAKVVTDLRCLHVFYHFTPETYALAINLLDRFLSKMKARPKYLSCIAMSCYFIATKTCEESQSVPRLTDLLTIGQCSFKPSDILRMESIILQKLNFDLNATTPLKFLEHYYRLLTETHPWLASYLVVEVLISRLEVCLSNVSAASSEAHILALSIIYHALQEADLCTGTTLLTSMAYLKAFSKVDDVQLKQCLKKVTNMMDDYLAGISLTPRTKLKWRLSSRTLAEINRPSLYDYSSLPVILEHKPTPCSFRYSAVDNSNDHRPCNTTEAEVIAGGLSNNFGFMSQ